MEFVPVYEVRLNDSIWSRQFALVHDQVLPYMWELLNDNVDSAEKSHCIENFKIAAGHSEEQHYGTVFLDTDLYKWIEAVAYCLAAEPNLHLENLCEQSITLIEAAQAPDGYINTYFSTRASDKRWSNLMEGHELYCAGHLIEAGVAYFQSTGKDRLLNIARRFADLIEEIFGEGKKRGYPGHPEIELALIRLYKVTGEEKYLSLAEYFIKVRGQGEDFFMEECNRESHAFIFPEMKHFNPNYFQSHKPVREQEVATGHAVRAMYLYCAMADLAQLTNDKRLLDACERLYSNVTTRQMYITGGIGTAQLGESFTIDYDLPLNSAYAETCASIGLMLLSSRMWLLDQATSHYDVWEQALYNSVLSGMGQDGHHYFYVNPLEVVPQTVHHNPMLSHVKTTRQKWFSVACCPPNLARILASLPGYIYALDDHRLYVLTHIGSSFNKGGHYVALSREGVEYTLTIEGGPMEVNLRLPENTELQCDTFGSRAHGYFTFEHKGGRQVYSYSLIPQVRVLRSHPRVSSTAGKVCVQRGLIVYCLEEIDNGTPLSGIRIPGDATFWEENVDWLHEDLPVLKTKGYYVSDAQWEGRLYHPQSGVYDSREITLIPYSQWGNRGENEMSVWVNEKLIQ